MNYSIGIIGAGPAGISCAITILNKNKNYKITIIEKGDVFKDKICGDGITNNTLNLLKKIGIEKDEIDEISSINTNFEIYDKNFELEKKFNNFRRIKRKKFDNFLREKAQKLGAKILYNKNAINFENEDEKIIVNLENKEYQKFDLIVISTRIDLDFARKSNIKISNSNAMALRCYMRTNKEILNSINYHPEELKNGYFWAYPVEKDLINCGIGIFDKKCEINLKELFEKCLIKYSKKFNLKLEKNEKINFWPLKCGFKEKQFSYNRVLLAGEIIGTTFYNTGEGITGALFNGIFAGELIVNLNGDYSKETLSKNYDKYLIEYSKLFKLNGLYSD